jgi:hypothetical protein
MQQNLEKYKKYKFKYLNLKKMLGGATPQEYCIMPPETVGFPVPIYKEIEDYKADCELIKDGGEIQYNESNIKINEINCYLNEINSKAIRPTLIIKVGSNDTVESKEYKLYSNTDIVTPINLRTINSILTRLKLRGDNKKNLFMLSLDPSNPSRKPFDVSIDEENNPLNLLSPPEENIKLIKACFPLATGTPNANSLLKKIIDLNANLILVNAMGSACYRSFKAILDNRPETYYLLYVDVQQSAYCPTDKIYNSEANFKICKDIKPKYPEWIDSNLT